MKAKYIGYITAFYFGFALATFTGYGWDTWQFYAICIPVIIGFAIEKFKYKEE